MRVVILASGRGSRLIPLTNFVPKALLPAANQPLLDYLLSNLHKVGCSAALITLGHLGDHVAEYLATKSYSLPITPVKALNWSLGPLASLSAALSHLKKEEPFVLIPADLYLPLNALELLFDSATPVPALLYDPHLEQGGTLVQVDTIHQVQQLTQSAVITPGFFPVLPALRTHRGFFQGLRLGSLPQPPTVFSLLQQGLAAGQPLHGLPIARGAWFDVDEPGHLLQLNEFLLTSGWPPTPDPPGSYLPAGTVKEGPLQSSLLTLGSDSTLEGPLLLGAQVTIGEQCLVQNGTTLGAYSTVADNTVLNQCISFDHTHIPANADLRNTILDAKGNILHAIP